MLRMTRISHYEEKDQDRKSVMWGWMLLDGGLKILQNTVNNGVALT